MDNQRIRNIVIVGGGTAGWSTAAALTQLFKHSEFEKITLVESSNIPTVGVGEATIPPMQRFNSLLGIDEKDFLKSTEATFKLGIEFVDWLEKGTSYMHPFGEAGVRFDDVPFYAHWIRRAASGENISPLDYSVAAQAAYKNKFSHPNPNHEVLSTFSYAYHFDAGLYAELLKKISISRGAQHVLGDVVSVNLDPENGYITSLQLNDDNLIEGDLFIDCTGFRGLLIKQALGATFTDWSHWLPCDRAAAVICDHNQPLKPYTQSTAHEAGWRWRIPLRHRVGNGYVYSTDFISDEDAEETLRDNLEKPTDHDVRLINFKTGMLQEPWKKNCVAIGLSSGFLEPLESTSIHLIQSAIALLIELFPTRAFEPAKIHEYNRKTTVIWEDIRDFIIAHYHQNNRDEEFWKYCRNYTLPDSLEYILERFSKAGYLTSNADVIFKEDNWFFVLTGQGIIPQSTNAATLRIPLSEVRQIMDQQASLIQTAVSSLSDHSDYLTQLLEPQTKKPEFIPISNNYQYSLSGLKNS